MGQAKQRGSFEKRKAEAIVRNAEQERERLARHERAKAEREANMSERDKRRRTQTRAILAAGMGIAASSITNRSDGGLDVDTF